MPFRAMRWVMPRPREPSPQVAVVVALVGVELARLASAGAAAGPDGRYALHERDQGLAVVDVGPRDPDGQGQTGPLGDQMDLRPVRAPVDRIRTRQAPPFQGPHVHRVDRAPRPVQLAAGSEFVQDQAVQPGPHPGLGPLGEPAVRRRPGRPERLRRQLLPRAARRCHENDRRQHLAVTVSARPPPWGRVGASGTTRWNSSHNSSGTTRHSWGPRSRGSCDSIVPRGRTRPCMCFSSGPRWRGRGRVRVGPGMARLRGVDRKVTVRRPPMR